jgi:hypothetical protein
VEVFPVDIKLDYKPRRVDYRALRAGRTIELMNFFHFDGAEMTLRHITLAGVCNTELPLIGVLLSFYRFLAGRVSLICSTTCGHLTSRPPN